jgi:hypothetical protein
VVGFTKISLAFLLLLGIVVPGVTKLAAAGIAVLMLGAVAMHVKVGDPARRSAPAFSLLVLALLIVLA